MASENFVVHVIAGIFLLVCFYYIARQRSHNQLLLSLFIRKNTKKLMDPCKILIQIFEDLEVDYECEVSKCDAALIDLPKLGKSLTQIDIKYAKILNVGQKPVVVLGCSVANDNSDLNRLKEDFKKATGINFEINQA